MNNPIIFLLVALVVVFFILSVMLMFWKALEWLLDWFLN